MARVYVELGAYNAIGDFEYTDDMSEEQMYENIDEIVQEFVSTEVGYTIVEDDEEY